MEPSESKLPLYTANGHDPEEEKSEPFKRAGCTALTVIVVLLLICTVIYFITGIAAMGLQFWTSMR